MKSLFLYHSEVLRKNTLTNPEKIKIITFSGETACCMFGDVMAIVCFSLTFKCCYFWK